MTYDPTGEVFEDGFQGDMLVVNGAIALVAQAVLTGLVRLRILQACNARFLELSMETGPITVIASEGGLFRQYLRRQSKDVRAGASKDGGHGLYRHDAEPTGQPRAAATVKGDRDPILLA